MCAATRGIAAAVVNRWPKAKCSSRCATKWSNLPQIEPDVTEYVLGRRRCTSCKRVTAARLPAGTPTGMCGPRLMALIALLTGAYHLSRRNAVGLLSDVLGVKLSLGTVSKVEGRVSDALGPAHTEALARVRQAKVKHLDATSWAQAGEARSLWTFACRLATAFVITVEARTADVRELVGSVLGTLVTDRGSQFGFWAMDRRQICWAHLVRKFVAFTQSARGSCVAWAQLLRACWEIQGVTGGVVHQLRPASPIHDGMLVKNWRKCAPCLCLSGNGVNETVPDAADVTVIRFSQGYAGANRVQTGSDGTLETTPGGDDGINANGIHTGANGVSESTATPTDVQAIPVGNGLPHSGAVHLTAISEGPDGVLNSAPAGDDHPFTPGDIGLIIGIHIVDLPGVPGQNNDDPPGGFANHFIAVYGGKLYDPSYGAGPFPDEMAHENASIDALSGGGVADVLEPAVQELVYFPMPGV